LTFGAESPFTHYGCCAMKLTKNIYNKILPLFI
jgi:hypothetical protein